VFNISNILFYLTPCQRWLCNINSILWLMHLKPCAIVRKIVFCCIFYRVMKFNYSKFLIITGAVWWVLYWGISWVYAKDVFSTWSKDCFQRICAPTVNVSASLRQEWISVTSHQSLLYQRLKMLSILMIDALWASLIQSNVVMLQCNLDFLTFFVILYLIWFFKKNCYFTCISVNLLNDKNLCYFTEIFGEAEMP